jgi:hypothetical protein
MCSLTENCPPENLGPLVEIYNCDCGAKQEFCSPRLRECKSQSFEYVRATYSVNPNTGFAEFGGNEKVPLPCAGWFFRLGFPFEERQGVQEGRAASPEYRRELIAEYDRLMALYAHRRSNALTALENMGSHDSTFAFSDSIDGAEAQLVREFFDAVYPNLAARRVAHERLIEVLTAWAKYFERLALHLKNRHELRLKDWEISWADWFSALPEGWEETRLTYCQTLGMETLYLDEDAICDERHRAESTAKSAFTPFLPLFQAISSAV